MPSSSHPGHSSPWSATVAPGLGLAAAAMLLIGRFVALGSFVDGAALAVLVGVVVRLASQFRSSHRQLQTTRVAAETDALTGLGNRRSLVADLDRAVADAAADRLWVLVMFDLDGFKGYNDTFGHPAGDALLARLGHNLAEAVAPWGRAYRLGGDEFCAVVTMGPEGIEGLLERSRPALTEQGDGFRIGASHGIVFLPSEATDPSLAIQIADQRLYGNKGTRKRQAVNQQTRDVLLQVLLEREPELHEHIHEVAELAVSVGRKMSLLPEELEEMVRAAELHDVGKMAVPDEILNKPGPLDREEMGLIRTHTIVGERILSAAPALGPVARLVRASHEKWDGSGYPDGLRGEEIPLAARIIAACDAYHAMTSDRPYAAAVPKRSAVAELRRCSGTHFDPGVVEVLCAELEGREPRAIVIDPSQDSQPDPAPLDATIDAGLAGELTPAPELD